jgi:hypothetical protein
MPLDAAIGRVFTASIAPAGGHHGHRFQRTKSSCGVVVMLSDASVQKAQTDRPSTQLIEATSCVEKSNAMKKAEELS